MGAIEPTSEYAVLLFGTISNDPSHVREQKIETDFNEHALLEGGRLAYPQSELERDLHVWWFLCG